MPDAAKIFTYWLRTVEHFIESEEHGENAQAINRKQIIVSFLSPEVYPYIEDAKSCADVDAVLRQTFINAEQCLLKRHLLVSRCWNLVKR